MKRWLLCLIRGHNYDFVGVIPGRSYGGAVAQYACSRCGSKKYKR